MIATMMTATTTTTGRSIHHHGSSRSSNNSNNIMINEEQYNLNDVSNDDTGRCAIEATSVQMDPEDYDNLHVNKEEEEDDNTTLLRVCIKSSSSSCSNNSKSDNNKDSIDNNNNTFHVPISLLMKREMEMRSTAHTLGIPSERWSQSRLFAEWKKYNQQQYYQKTLVSTTTSSTEIDITLLYPPPQEQEQEQGQGDSMSLVLLSCWQPWLTKLIRQYYNTGMIRIPNVSIGHDVLLALEYFGILYSPTDQLVFDSMSVYLRIKLWSNYFTHIKSPLANWILQYLSDPTTPSRHVYTFVTCPDDNHDDDDDDELLYYLDNTSSSSLSSLPMIILDGNLSLNPTTRYGKSSSRAVVYEFFNNNGKEDDDDEDDDDEQEEGDATTLTTTKMTMTTTTEHYHYRLDGLMRKDFCSFLQTLLPGTMVTFTLKHVMAQTKKRVKRAVLRINVGTMRIKSPTSTTTTTITTLPEENDGINHHHHHKKRSSPYHQVVDNDDDEEEVNHHSGDRDGRGGVIIPVKPPQQLLLLSTTTTSTCLSSPSNRSLAFSTPTASTQPITPSTLGDFSMDHHHASRLALKLSSGGSNTNNSRSNRAIFLRRSKTEHTPSTTKRLSNNNSSSTTTTTKLVESSSSSYGASFPHDEYSIPPSSSTAPPPQQQQQQAKSPPPSSSLWTTRQYYHDEPSVDQPRDPIEYTPEFVRSLSEKIIRQTIADMDSPPRYYNNNNGGGGGDMGEFTMNHSLMPSAAAAAAAVVASSMLRSDSATPSDEGRHGMKLTTRNSMLRYENNNENQRHRLPPPLELDKAYDLHHEQRQATTSNKNNNKNNKRVLQHSQLDVIGIPKALSDPGQKALSDIGIKLPLAHVNVNYGRNCDSSVMSALSNPFDEQARQAGVESPFSLNRQPSFASLSDFRTTVDAISVMDEASVKIGPPQDIELEEVARKSRARKRSAPKFKREKVYEEEEEDSQPGCADSFYTMLCAYSTGDSTSSATPTPTPPVKQGRRRSGNSDEWTPRTEDESDEDDRINDRQKSSKKKVTTGDGDWYDPIDAIGEMAEAIVGSSCLRRNKQKHLCGISSKTDKSARRGRSRARRAYGDEWSATSPAIEEEEMDEEDDAVSEIIEHLSVNSPQTTSTITRQHLPPRPMSHNKDASIRISVREKKANPALSPTGKGHGLSHAKGGMPLERIQDILRNNEWNGESTQGRSVNVMRNLELLKTADDETDRIASIRRISGNDPVIYKTSASSNRGKDDKKRGGKKGFLGFFRKK